MRVMVFFLIAALWAFPAHAERRVALVIGNSAYEHVPQLANPKNDAADMAKKLQGLGFEVVVGEDLDLNGMRSKAREFIAKLDGADMALFYYAGHGLQVSGNNYIAPVDAKLATPLDLEFETLPINLVMSAMEQSTKVNLVFLDACRDNPLAENLARSMGTRSSAVGRGLAKLGSGVGSLIAFATQPGNVALDGDGRNSPFTTALLKHLGTPGQSVTDDLIQVRKEVLDATEGKQVPWDNSSLTGPVILKDKPKEEPKVEPAPAPEVKAPQQTDNAVELAYWDGVKDASDPSLLQTYLDQYPEGLFAKLARAKIALLEKQAAAQKPSAPAQPDNAAELAYWNSIKDSGGTAYLEAYLAKYPQGQFADLARIRIDEIKAAQVKAEAEAEAKTKLEAEAKSKQEAETKAQADAKAKTDLEAAAKKDADTKVKLEAEAKAKEEDDKLKAIETAKLEPPAAPETMSDLAPIDPAELALATQKELARIGCLSGRADGKWGSGSERALKDYAERQGIELASLQPSTDILDRLRATTVRVCPLVCGKGLEEKNGRCEKVKREAKVEPKPETPTRSTPQNVAPEKPKTKSAQASSGRECVRCCGGTGNAGCSTVCKAKNQSWAEIGQMYAVAANCKPL